MIFTGIGTHNKFYVESNGDITDITPLRATVTLGSNAIASTNGSGIVTITHTSHGASVGDYVTISGATAFASLTTGQLNQEFIILSVPSTNTYTVNTGGTASSATSGGGASISAAYQLQAGAESNIYGGGWGAGTWSHPGGWSSSSSSLALSDRMRLWTQDNFGEDLLFAPRYGAIYRYDASSPGRGAPISGEGSASEVPASVLEVLVAPDSRITFALGCPPVGSSTMDPLLVRWTDYENYLKWNPSDTTAAGGIRLSVGSTIITGVKTKQEILVWTDVALYGFSFVGGDDIYTSYLIDGNVDLIGPLAKAQFSGVTYWMGKRGFYKYDGRVTRLECPFEDYVFRDLNYDSAYKICAGTNSKFGEIWWHYASADSAENDRYLVYNYNENVWYYGTMGRLCWIDRGAYDYPRAIDVNGWIYAHEFGLDDGSTSPVSAIHSYAEIAPMEIGGQSGDDLGKGDRIMFIDRFIPDVTFRSSTNGTPTLTYIFKERDFPGLAYREETSTVTKTYSVDQYTEKLSVSLKARAIAFRVENNEVGSDWRLGSQRVQVRTDGRRE